MYTLGLYSIGTDSEYHKKLQLQTLPKNTRLLHGKGKSLPLSILTVKCSTDLEIINIGTSASKY